MTAEDLREWLNAASASGWEWSETAGWVSAAQLRREPPLGHLFAYLLASNFIVPMQVPAALRADARPPPDCTCCRRDGVQISRPF